MIDDLCHQLNENFFKSFFISYFSWQNIYKRNSSISMLVMSLLFTFSVWLVNLTYFAYLQFVHILTFAFLSKFIVRLITYAIYTKDHI